MTDRCNLRCRYCMPEHGIQLMSQDEVISFEEIIDFIKVGVGFGINKIRLTGGEPLVRKGIVDLVRMIRNIPGIRDLGMTTNGILLTRYAMELKEAGLDRVNISLDSMDEGNFKYITRVGKLDQVLAGIKTAKDIGLTPVKINCVIINDSNEPDALAVKQFGLENGVRVRFIKEMDLETGVFSAVEGGKGGKCKLCNRLRLTANGFLKPCLFSELGYSIRDLGYEDAFRRAISNKPEKGSLNNINSFYNIGG